MLHSVEHYAVGDGYSGGSRADALNGKHSVEVVERERGESVVARSLKHLQLPAFGLQLGRVPRVVVLEVVVNILRSDVHAHARRQGVLRLGLSALNVKLGERRCFPVDKEFLTAFGENNRLEVGRLGVKRLWSGGVLRAELCDVYSAAIPAACSRQNYALFLRDDLNQVEVASVIH